MITTTQVLRDAAALVVVILILLSVQITPAPSVVPETMAGDPLVAGEQYPFPGPLKTAAEPFAAFGQRSDVAVRPDADPDPIEVVELEAMELEAVDLEAVEFAALETLERVDILEREATAAVRLTASDDLLGPIARIAEQITVALDDADIRIETLADEGSGSTTIQVIVISRAHAGHAAHATVSIGEGCGSVKLPVPAVAPDYERSIPLEWVLATDGSLLERHVLRAVRATTEGPDPAPRPVPPVEPRRPSDCSRT